LNLIGKAGFGKKGSIGKGHFEAETDEKFEGFDEAESNYYMTLSPTILHKADSGAVVKLNKKLQYIGGAIDNGIVKPSYVQGYSIVVPFDFKGMENG